MGGPRVIPQTRRRPDVGGEDRVRYVGRATRRSAASQLSFQRSLQIADLCPHVFHVGIDRQRQAEALQGGHGVKQLQVAVSHAHRRGKVMGIAFDGLAAVADRLAEPLHLIVGNRPLIPGFGETVRFLNQPRRVACRLIEAAGIVEANDGLQLVLLLFGSVAIPEFPNAVLGQQTAPRDRGRASARPSRSLLSKLPRNPIDNTAARRVVREPPAASRARVPNV